jgi:S1-C subfamily serine protease
MLRAAAIATIAATTACLAGTALAREITAYKDGGWDISANTDSRGLFANCSGFSAFGDGISLLVVLKTDGWALGLAKRGFRFVVDSDIHLRVSIDGQALVEGNGVAAAADFVTAELPRSALNAFRAGHAMEIVGPDFHVNLDLAGTSRLVAVLSDCLARYAGGPKFAAREQRPSAARPATVQPAPAPPASPAVASASPPPAAEPAVSKPSEPPRRGDSSGTGFILAAAGHIVTNAHVVKECKQIRVQRPGDVETEAKLVVTDGVNDLALLKAELKVGPGDIARVASSRSIQAGSRIAVYGFPLSGALSSAGNVVEGNVSALAGLENNAGYFQISAPVQPGNSGGPLLDARGNVVGMVSGKLDDLELADSAGTLPQNVNFAIKSNVLMNFLDANSVAYEIADGGDEIDPPAIAARAQRFTVLVNCTR